MTGTEVVEAAFAAFEITGNAVLLAQRMKILKSTRHQLVGIGLMPHVPHHPVAVKIQGLVQGKGEFHHPQARPQVTATGGDHVKMLLPDLAGDRLQFGGGQAMQLIRVRQLAQMHADPDSSLAIYEVRSCRRRSKPRLSLGTGASRVLQGASRLQHWTV